MNPTTNPSILPSALPAFRGTVITPDSPDYDRARALFYGGMDPHPAVIVRVADADDIARVIAYARETGLPLSVRSGGHSLVGHSVVDRGIVIDLHNLRELDLDVAKRTAWAGAGLTAAEYSTAAGAHGLVTGFGDTGSVGIGGITLGGGIGFLVREYGLTIDDLLAADMVTADGQLRRVDADHEPDLFWAIRGGGGNFGVVTRFQFRLHELPEVVGGMFILPATPDTVAGFIAAAEAAPDELSTIANVMPAMPMPFLPPEQHGKLVIFAFLVYAGPAEAGEQALAPFRALATPLADMLKPMPYHQIYMPEDDSYHPTGINRNFFMDHIDRTVASTIIEHLNASDASLRVAQLRVLGGAMARVPDDATAFAHRKSRIMVNVANFITSDADRPRRVQWADEFAAALHQSDPGAYVGFLENEGDARIRAAYPPATYARLATIKRAYDPENLFRSNQNIPPA